MKNGALSEQRALALFSGSHLFVIVCSDASGRHFPSRQGKTIPWSVDDEGQGIRQGSWKTPSLSIIGTRGHRQ